MELFAFVDGLCCLLFSCFFFFCEEDGSKVVAGVVFFLVGDLSTRTLLEMVTLKGVGVIDFVIGGDAMD